MGGGRKEWTKTVFEAKVHNGFSAWEGSACYSQCGKIVDRINFRHFIFVCFLLGNSPASELYMPTFRNTLFRLHRRVGMK